MTPSARIQSAIDLLSEIAASSRPADGVVAFFFRNRRFIGSKDRRAIAERVYGILRRKARLDWWLGRAGVEPTARSRVLADVVITDGIGAKDLAHLFDGTLHAPLPLSGGERRLASMLDGKPIFHHEMPDWVRSEFPQWLEAELRAVFGEDLAAEMGAMRDEAPLDLRANTLKATRDEALAALQRDGVVAMPSPLSPWGLRIAGRVMLNGLAAWRDGLVEVQDEGSQLVALLTDPRPGQAVVDYCAGAGGKTLALAARMQNKGRLIACDTHEIRIDRAQDRLRRAGVHNVTRKVLNAESGKWAKRNSAAFDRVLVDAPCTGTGTWRRNPDAKWQMTPQDLAELTALQRRILDQASRLVKPGGRLVYATCSLLPAEDEGAVEAFLAGHPDFRLLPIAEVWREAIGGDCPGGDQMLRLTPARHGTDGFFVAAMLRSSDPRPPAADEADHKGDHEQHQEHEE